MVKTMTGVIKREFLPKGYCFVEGEDGEEYFLHANELPDGEWSRERIRKGVRVEFTPEATSKGNRATGATLIVGAA